MKKTISIILAILLVLSTLPLAYAQENGPELIVSEGVAKTGDTAEISISLRNNPGITAIRIYIEYDNENLLLVHAENGDLLSSMSTSFSPSLNTYPYQMQWSIGTENISGDGVIASLVFKVLENAEETTYPINISYAEDDIFNTAFNNIHFDVISGGVTVSNEVDPSPLSDFEYEISSDGIIITGYSGNKKDIVINSSYQIEEKTYDVVGIGESAFEANESITSIVIPETVGFIGDYAFYDCLSLKKVTVLSKNSTIGELALGYYYISRKENGVVQDFTIIGYPNTPSEEYADSDEEIAFISLQDSCDHIGGIATCISQAVCTTCGEPYGEIDPNNHVNTEIRESISATCTTDGYKGDTWCLDCGTKIDEGETIPALGHDYNAVVTDPTCTEAGHTTYTCTRCSDTYTEAGVPATGHTFGSWVDNGENHTHTCANCSLTETEAHSFTITETAPTCTEDGKIVSVCSGCGKTVTEIIPKLGHDYTSVVNAPTCTEAGYTTFTCLRCGDTYTEAGVPATGHSFGTWENLNNESHIRHCANCDETQTAEHEFTVTEVPPTETENGMKTHTCEVCGYVKAETIPATGHHYVSVETPPTCTEDGYTTYTCSTCGDSYTEPGEPATGHSFGSWTDSGENHIRTCSRCSETETAAHSFTVIETDPTCTDTGRRSSICSICGHTETVTIPALGHDYKAVETAPTCTAAGYTTYTCSRCGDAYTEAGAPATGHIFGEWESANEVSHVRHCSNCDVTEDADHEFTVIEVQPTETENGSRTSICTICGFSMTETIPATSHHYVSVETPPTCTEDGYTTYTCSTCGDSYTEPGEPATGHSFGSWTDSGENHIRTCSRCSETETAVHSFIVIETDPTCTDTGRRSLICSICGHTETVTIPALGHDYKAVETAPTCTEAGYITYTCSRCGNTFIEPGAPATGHSFGDWTSVDNATHIRNCENCDATETESHRLMIYVTAPTCTENGNRTSTCTVCGFSMTEILPAKDHNYVAVETAPTCTADGFITYTCSDCGDTYINPGAPALGHNFGYWTDNGTNHIRTCSRCSETETAAHIFTVIETDPTCTDTGSRSSICSICGHTETVIIPALGHDYKAVETAPTCTEAGYITYTCSRCGNTFIEPGAPATGHSFGDWTSVNNETHIRHCANCVVTETESHSLAISEIIPTCTENGNRISTCTVCGFTMTEIIPAKDHNYVAVDTAPTCIADGFITYTCIDCGDTYTNPGAPAMGHNFGNWTDNGTNHIRTCSRCSETETAAHSFTVIETDPTCTDTGRRSSICSICGHTETVTIPALGHDYKAVETAPTCTAAGYTTYTCSRCGDAYTEAGAPATGHIFGEWESANEVSHVRHCSNCDVTEDADHEFTVIEVQPTETENGSRTSICTVCGFSTTEILPATGHHYVSVETPPTCTEDGFTTFTCIDCGDTYVNPGTPAMGHNWGAWMDIGEKHVHFCLRCNEEETADHSFKINETAATCTEAGSRVSICSVCGKYVEEEIPVIGHDYVAVETAPTCTEAGYTTYTCSVCGDSYIIDGAPALGHDYIVTVIEPTDKDYGYTLHECSRCGDAYNDNYVEPLTPQNIKGDVSYDNQVDNRDLILLARYLVHLVEFDDIQKEAADYNGDGSINNSDLVLIARFIVSEKV